MTIKSVIPNSTTVYVYVSCLMSMTERQWRNVKAADAPKLMHYSTHDDMNELTKWWETVFMQNKKKVNL